MSDAIWRIFQTLKSYILAKRIKSKSNKTGPANLHQLSFLDVFIKLKILWNQSEWWVSEVIWQIFLTLKSDLHFETRIKTENEIKQVGKFSSADLCWCFQKVLKLSSAHCRFYSADMINVESYIGIHFFLFKSTREMYYIVNVQQNEIHFEVVQKAFLYLFPLIYQINKTWA